MNCANFIFFVHEPSVLIIYTKDFFLFFKGNINYRETLTKTDGMNRGLEKKQKMRQLSKC